MGNGVSPYHGVSQSVCDKHGGVVAWTTCVFRTASGMQNRANRTLLFGARPNAGADASAGDLEALESDNQAGVDHLRGSAGLMKDVCHSCALFGTALILMCVNLLTIAL